MPVIPQLARFANVPFNAGTRITLIDYFTGDGTTKDFTLINKSGVDVGKSVEVGPSVGPPIMYPRSTGAATVSGNVVSLNSAPLVNQQVLVPGVAALVFKASDQNDVLGRVFETYFFIADPDTIQLFNYEAWPGNAGIKLEFFQKITNEVATPSWFQFAPANPDGTVGTYQAAGTPLYTPALKAQDTVQANTAALDTTFVVADGSQFTVGDFVNIDKNMIGHEEIVKILSISGNTITTTGMSYTHTAGAVVLSCGRKIFAKMTVPLGAVGSQVMNMYGLPLRVRARVSART